MDQQAAELVTQWRSWVGLRVRKKSGKPFKSTQKVATVKDVVKHKQRPKEFAFTFEEDDSFVACAMCILE